ncbi:peptidoglycan DD-metalloendopeptidase family protein [Chitinilyticum piscinae]|uniref:peptidoglycan DD-metalloendopeptidase family protein n=1 Tax=Chitinilyticum piscinae TaxID=2866724 RepID=UPI0027E4B26C|nr:peptidoglycan DD-metalloendopeptidase family protein [Chitinilyticum piscinae]
MKVVAAGLCAVIALAGCAGSAPRQPAPITERPVGQPTPVPTPLVTPVPAPVATSKPLGQDGEVRSAPVSTPAPVVTPAPVRAQSIQSDVARTYTVQRGDTLYKIAREQGVPAKELVTLNNLANMDDIKAGQVLKISAASAGTKVAVAASPTPVAEVKSYPRAVRQPYSASAAESVQANSEGQSVAVKQQSVTVDETKPKTASAVRASAVSASKIAEKQASASSAASEASIDWGRPTAGKVSNGFTEERKGIDIAGKMGQSVVASAGGKVVYAGSGLRGYGKMVIVQHGNGYLSTYAHNSKLLVKEGDLVKKGEKIAEMGNTDSDETKLHFEIRRFGKPVDPTKYISAE